MKAAWHFLAYLLICLPHHLMVRVAHGAVVQMNQYVTVGRHPLATTETVVDISGLRILECAKMCLALRAACQGFRMRSGEVYPCVLLEGLTGVSDPPNGLTKTYITAYYEGVRHSYFPISMTWIQGIETCQSAGMVMVSYPLTMEKRNWMNSFNKNALYVAAKKDAADPSKVYDVNTNELLTVDWMNGPGDATSNVVCLIMATNKFDRLRDNITFSEIHVFCSEEN